jgi:hypothetical protein
MAILMPILGVMGWTAYNHPQGWSRISLVLTLAIVPIGSILGGFEIGLGVAEIIAERTLRPVAAQNLMAAIGPFQLPLWTAPIPAGILLMLIFFDKLHAILGEKRN